MAGCGIGPDHFLGLNCGSVKVQIRHQYKSVSRNWERCEREAASNGVWIEHGSCPWDNSVRLFYKPEEGDEVEARGRPATIYRDRGDSYDVDYLDGELEREEHLA